jgi:uncharacterized membrane protein
LKTKLVNILDDVRSSFWFVPALMVAAAIFLAWITVSLDEVFDSSKTEGLGWIYTGGAEGARLLLSTIAGSMITVASVTFSITIVALTLTSSQFGPRLLRNFMWDGGNQLTLGTFIATFVYCLLVLRTIRGNGETSFVPHVSVTVALVLALAGLGVLIYFIHHVALGIQANSVVASVSAELDEAIIRLFPQQPRQEQEKEKAAKEFPIAFERTAHRFRPVKAVMWQPLITKGCFALRRRKISFSASSAVPEILSRREILWSRSGQKTGSTTNF